MSGWPLVDLATPYAALDQDFVTDVAIVGCGLAGASLALHLAERNVSSCVLEAAQPADGASGRNAGHVRTYLEGLKAIRTWPDEGRRFIDTFIANRNIVFDLCRRYAIQADAEASGTIEVSKSRSTELQRKAQFWKLLGYDVEVKVGTELQQLIGSPVYDFGLHWREGGRVNPYLFTNGLAASAVRRGVRIFGNSKVLACEPVGDRWRLRTANGSVAAERVVICTNGHHGNTFFPELSSSNYPLVACGLATCPLDPNLLASLNPSRAALTQYPADLFPLIIDSRGRLITATIPGHGRADRAHTYFNYLVRYLHRFFPQTRDASIQLESYWTGITYSSSPIYGQDFPKIYRVAPGVLALMNLGTWGNVVGPLLGMNLAEVLVCDQPKRLILPIEKPTIVRFRNLFDFKIRGVMIPLARVADHFNLL